MAKKKNTSCRCLICCTKCDILLHKKLKQPIDRVFDCCEPNKYDYMHVVVKGKHVMINLEEMKNEHNIFKYRHVLTK